MDINPAAVRRRHLLRRSLGWILAAAALLALAGALTVNRFHLRLIPLGGESQSLREGQTYREQGVRVLLAGNYFLRDGLEVGAAVDSQGHVDTQLPGEYSIHYQAKLLFLKGEASRSVTVLEDLDPVITLKAIPGHYTLPGTAYQEEGFSAMDPEDGDLTAQVLRQEESGCVTYTVTDSRGNTVTVRRDIFYDDPVPPMITLLGGKEIRITVGDDFSDPGFTAEDNLDGDLTGSVTSQGTVDPFAPGSYTLTYTIRDAYGNEAAAERTVIVEKRKIPETVTPEEKTIYLTFDDGPGPCTAQLLDVLKKYDVKATFFVIRSDYLYLLPRMAEEGHAIGIHSVTHNYDKIYASEEAFFEELEKMQDIIYEKTGVRTWLLRFPGGSSNTVSKFNKGVMTRLTKAVEAAGYSYFDWNVDSNDAGGAKTAKEVYNNVKAGVKSHRVSIVLQHDIKDFSVDAVERIIRWGLENGYTFRCLDQTSPTAHHGVNN